MLVCLACLLLRGWLADYECKIKRRLVDYSNFIRRSLLYALRRPSLGFAGGKSMELCAEEFLYTFVAVHRFYHDASLRQDKRKGKGLEIWRHLLWGRSCCLAVGNPHFQEGGGHHVL
jgi:hypothetical protein